MSRTPQIQLTDALAHPQREVDSSLLAQARGLLVHEEEQLAVCVGDVVDALADAGIYVYFVGGLVRDWVLGEASADVDILFVATLPEVLQVLHNRFPQINPIVRQLDNPGSITWGNAGTGLDLCMVHDYRERTGPFFKSVHTLGTSLLGDALTRDFTCNALYYDTQIHRIVDPMKHGVEDAEHKRLRLATHPQMRHFEPICFRYIGFEQRGYSATADTRAYVETHVDRDMAKLATSGRLPIMLRQYVVRKGRDLAGWRQVLSQYASPATMAAFDKAVDLLPELGDAARFIPIDV